MNLFTELFDGIDNENLEFYVSRPKHSRYLLQSYLDVPDMYSDLKAYEATHGFNELFYMFFNELKNVYDMKLEF